LVLGPNRVRRSYSGGRLLDELAGAASPSDSEQPEDWLASLTHANNPGAHIPDEGLCVLSIEGEAVRLRDLVLADPVYFLGSAHLAAFGPDPKLLVKFLDPAIRLHFQVHPSTDFARAFLSSPSGKTEAYHVLAVRPDCDAQLYLGFQHPPTRQSLTRMIASQDIAAIKACFDPITVRAGDTVIVPAGTPHALGAGLFVVELQEPSDLVVRFEFERGGRVLPESSRFMGRGLEFCLDVFDLNPRPISEEINPFRCHPKRMRTWPGGHSSRDELIGSQHTPCFRLTRLHLGEPITMNEAEWILCIVADGACDVSDSTQSHRISKYHTFLLPAGVGPVTLTPVGHSAVILECRPPIPA
jgi:mannose-6-phosphate isomerase